MMYKKVLASTMGLAFAAMGASSAVTATTLNFDAGVTTCTYHGTCFVKSGSYFGMDTNGSGSVTPNERTALAQNDGIVLGTAQAASGSHSGAPDGSETAGIDAAWGFFGNTGLSYTSSPTNVLSQSGNTATIDMSGWTVAWNGIASIPMGAGAWGANADGVADITCGVDCGDGDTYTLAYTATVPMGDPSGFGGVGYDLFFTGTISGGAITAPAAVPVPAAVWLFGSGLVGLAGVARRRKAA